MKKKLIALTLGMLMVMSDVGFVYADTETNNLDLGFETQNEIDNVVNEIDESIYIDSNNNEIIFDEYEIKNICSEIDIDMVNMFYQELGIPSINEDELADMFIAGIDNLNDDLSEGELQILENGTIIDSEDDDYYLQGGSTYDETHWWGRRRYKSTKKANKWAYELQKCAAANAATSVLAGAVFGGVGAIPNGLCSAYCWALGNEVSYVNSLSSRGIKADIYWCLTYSVKKQ